MDDVFAGAAEAITEALGEPIVHFDGATTTEVVGVFSNGFQRVAAERGPGVKSQRPEVTVTSDEVEFASGHKIFRGTLADFEGEFHFEIVSTRPDIEETSLTLVLKKA